MSLLKCCNPIQEPFEFSIPCDKSIYGNTKFPELFPLEHNICELKEKIIYEYLDIINKLECGIQEDLEFLLEEISLVDIMENG